MDRDISPTIKALMYASVATFILQNYVAADGMIDMLQTAMYLGADEILYKPFGPETLLAVIRQVLNLPVPEMA